MANRTGDGKRQMSKPIVKVDIQGAPRIAGNARILRRGDGVVAIEVNMPSKYCVKGGYIISGHEPPKIIIDANECTLYVDETKDRSKSTIISFPRWPGWTVLCADISRYTLLVCLVDGFDEKEQRK